MSVPHSMELAHLQEELARSKADKEFVWSLWKQLQKNSPDITEAISIAVNREKTKQEIAQQKLVSVLKERDAQIEALQEELDNQGKAIAKLEATEEKLSAEKKQVDKKWIFENHRVQEYSDQLNKTSEEMGILRSRLVERDNEVQQHLKAVEVLLKRSGNLEKEMKSLSQEKAQLSDENKSLQNKVKKLEQDKKNLSTQYSAAFAECDALKYQVSEKERLLYEKTESYQKEKQKTRLLRQELRRFHNDEWYAVMKSDPTENQTVIDLENDLTISDIEEVTTLHVQIQHLLREKTQTHETLMKLTQELENRNDELKDCKRMLTLAETKLHDKEYVIGPDVHQQLIDFKQMLEKTEKELFELKTHMKTKNDEVCCLREKHDRRLQRMKTLKESHDLILKQLKTYETNSPVGNRKVRVAGGKFHSTPVRCFKHEGNTDSVWNELTKYKSQCQQLQYHKLIAEDELDSLQTDCALYKSTIAELRACLQQERKALEFKVKALHEIEDKISSTTSIDHKKIEKLETINEQLKEEKSNLADENRLLSNECYQLRQETYNLQQSIISLKHKWEVERISRLTTKSTMTDCLTKTDSATQVEPVTASQESVTMTTDNTLSLSSSSSLFPCTTRRHKRRYSDSQIPLHRYQMTEALNKTHQLSNTINLPTSHICECIPKWQEEETPAINQTIKSRKVDINKGIRSAVVKGTTVKDGRVTAIPVKGKRSYHDSSHKCLWFTQLRSCQQRLKTLTKQVTLLTMTKRSLSQSLEHTQQEKMKLERENKSMQDKLISNRTVIQDLRSEIRSLESSCNDLQGKCSALESMGLKALTEQDKRTQFEEENKKLLEEKKSLNIRCSNISAQLKSVKDDLKIKETEYELLQEKIQNYERDLKQKRQLVNDQKKRMNSMEDKANCDKDKIMCLTSQVSSLQETLEHCKHRVNSLKTQSEGYTKEKERLTSTLTKCQQELESTIQQLSTAQDDCRKKNQQLTLLKRSTEKRATESKREYQLALIEVERKVETAELLVLEYREFLMDLARELSVLQQEALYKRHCHSGTKKQINISKRARDIAQMTFDLSDAEVDELMSEKRQPTSPDIKDSHYSLASRIGRILNAETGPHLSKQKLMSEFSSCVYSLLS